jgi:hypothetical protein
MPKAAVPVVLGELRCDPERTDPAAGHPGPVPKFRKEIPA